MSPSGTKEVGTGSAGNIVGARKEGTIMEMHQVGGCGEMGIISLTVDFLNCIETCMQ